MNQSAINVPSYSTMENKTFNEAVECIKQNKTPVIWSELAQEKYGKYKYTNLWHWYKNRAEQAGQPWPNRGLYFFISTDNEIVYVGRKKWDLIGRVRSHLGKGKKEACRLTQAITMYQLWTLPRIYDMNTLLSCMSEYLFPYSALNTMCNATAMDTRNEIALYKTRILLSVK